MKSRKLWRRAQQTWQGEIQLKVYCESSFLMGLIKRIYRWRLNSGKWRSISKEYRTVIGKPPMKHLRTKQLRKPAMTCSWFQIITAFSIISLFKGHTQSREMKSDPVNLLGLNLTGKPNLVTCTKKFSFFFCSGIYIGVSFGKNNRNPCNWNT